VPLNVLSDLSLYSLPGALHGTFWPGTEMGDGFNFGPRRASSAVAHLSRCDNFLCAVIQKKGVHVNYICV